MEHETSHSPFNNSNLFSNHYLGKLIQANPEWYEEAGLEDVFQRISDLFQRKSKVLENYNESQLEENFIRPVLRILGHFFGVQGKVQKRDRTPDYAFFPDQESLNEADASLGADDYYKRAVAVGDAKSWKVSLDKRRSGRGEFEMQNPSFQIDVYLRDTPPKWAVLTNGRLWRLYHESTSYKLDVFYEVDLPALLLAGELENFKYFYLFFRREAFPQVVDGECFLDRIREGSVAYAQEIGEDLKENVYRAMKILAEGFLAEPSNQLSNRLGRSMSDGAVREVQDNALRLLYRLLFLFYAESRNLLDTNNKYYYELSLQRLKYEIAARLDRGDPLLSVRYSYWEALKGLFSLINDGSESRGVSKDEFYIPAYNGGLFDPAKNRFLEEKRIGDSYLARALDFMARSHDREKGFVDYSSLEIRHLGSIYEGLLEYRLKIANREMAVVKEKGKEVWFALSEAGGRKVLDTIPAGGLYLVTDKGERKATGSYYTPDYIVKYIVKNTIEPLIERKRQEWLGSNRPFAEYVLSIKVLDPAMGSGHFLVEATDQLARWLVQAWATARPEDVESKDVAGQDIHWARREVVRNCIYGVDLNPMAVELAKLSLWLTTVASNKPLSFLDHHLRCGNSLIGAELEKLVVLPAAKAEEQPPIWKFVLKQHTDALLKKYSLMASLPDDSLQMVKWKEERFREIQESELSRRLRELANVWLSTYFGNEVSDDDYYELQNRLSPEKFPDWAGFREKEWFVRAQGLAAEKRFFHWEMEFPEAFNGKNRGFDIVIGNPPYIRDRLQETIEDSTVFAALFESAYQKYDIYALFIESSINLLIHNGHLGFIVPNKIMAARYATPLRKLILSKTSIRYVIDVSEIGVFKNVSVYPIILLVERCDNGTNKNNKLKFAKVPNLINNESMNIPKITFIEQDVYSTTPDNMFILTLNDSNINITNKMKRVSLSLGELCNINEGIHTGNLREELVISCKIDEFTYPLYRGENFERYDSTYDNLFIRYNWDIIKNNPNGYGSLREKAIFEASEKIICREIHIRLSCTYDKEQKYFLNHLYSITRKIDFGESLLYTTALINSKLLSFFFDIMFINAHISGGYRQYKAFYLKQLPISRISFTTPAPERSRLVQELQELYTAGKFDEILTRVDACLPKDAEGNFILEQEKSDVVHDLLAFLAEQMLEMNKQKQQEIKGFLGWLEGYVGARVEDLRPKTKIQGYYDHDYNDFLAVLKKNKKKLQIDPSRREPAEALAVEFRASVVKLGPLRERIERADGLIDQIVYRLYGLTEEEIRLVEGNTS